MKPHASPGNKTLGKSIKGVQEDEEREVDDGGVREGSVVRALEAAEGSVDHDGDWDHEVGPVDAHAGQGRKRRLCCPGFGPH